LWNEYHLCCAKVVISATDKHFLQSYRDGEWASRIGDAGSPYVSVEGYAEVPGVYSMLADYSGSVETALNYLLRERTRLELAPVYAEVFQEESADNWAEQPPRRLYKLVQRTWDGANRGNSWNQIIAAR
jgi:hypothetical protein